MYLPLSLFLSLFLFLLQSLFLSLPLAIQSLAVSPEVLIVNGNSFIHIVYNTKLFLYLALADLTSTIAAAITPSST